MIQVNINIEIIIIIQNGYIDWDLLVIELIIVEIYVRNHRGRSIDIKRWKEREKGRNC